MTALTHAKLLQAQESLSQSEADVWLTFVRETAEGGDPVLPLLIEGGLTWQSALLVSPNRRVAIVGNYDADALRPSGDWDDVIGYVQSLREPLLETLEALIPSGEQPPRLAVNYSVNDVKADGLSHGLFLLLETYLRGTRFENALVSAESLVMALRGRKSAEELRRMRAAITATDALFALVPGLARPGVSERQIYEAIQREVAARGLGFAWDRSGDPIVNAGPDSMIGHGVPSADIRLAPGHILHLDLGVVVEEYSSDMQRCWYLPEPGETQLPSDVRRALDAVNGAITAGAAQLKPGVAGWEVDAAARAFLTAAGYPEYLHAFGHQVGRVAHDGGAILGPRWDRYGQTPYMPIQQQEVYTLELGVFVEGRGYLGLEEMVVVTADGCEWLTERQWDMPLLEPLAGEQSENDVRIA